MQMPAEEKNSVRRDGFVLARLPQLEMYFYYAIWIAHSFGALLLVYKITYDLQRSMQAWLPRSEYVFFIILYSKIIIKAWHSLRAENKLKKFDAISTRLDIFGS